MKLDSIALSSVTYEIKKQLIPAKIIDLYQLNKYEILLVLKNNNATGKLFLSIQPDRMAFFLSECPLPLENFSSLFFHQLKNWVQSGTLLDIEHFQFDRIIKLIIQPYHKFGLSKQYQLILEFMGKHSNAILIDEQSNIKGALKQIGSDINRYREIKAGIPYIYPPKQDKVNPLTINQQEFLNMLRQHKGAEDLEYLWQLFHHHFNGLGMISSQEIVSCMNLPVSKKLHQIPEPLWPDLWNQFFQLRQKMLNNHLSPVVLIDKKSDQIIDYFLLCPVNQPSALQLPFQQTSSCLEFVFNRLREDDKKQDLYHTINSILKKNMEKLEEKKGFLQDRKREIETREEYKKKGELIKANLWRIKPGTREITLIDYSDTHQPKMTVLLKPDLSPIQNANHYFKKYKKLQQNRGILEKQLNENHGLLQQLKDIKATLAGSRNALEELSSLYNKLAELKYVKKDQETLSKRKTEQTPAISKFLSPDGWAILVGKNNKQNETILRYLSSGNDFWLHSLGKPGSHVIIKNHRNLDSPPHSTLMLAAHLAGFYSKTKDKENALIICTRRKYVRKPKNAKMGKVIYSNEKIIPVIIDHNEIKKDIQRLLLP